MTTPAHQLSNLSRGSGATTPIAPRPSKRWKSRVLLPIVILTSVAALLGYAARASLWPSVDVWVVPVVAKQSAAPVQGARANGENPSASGPGALLAQAPGWIEPSPYAVGVPALTQGVVKEVLVLEGDRVEAGQVVARLIDEDAKLAVRRAAAELGERRAGVERAQADLGAAIARADEVREEAGRKRPLVEAGGISAGQLAQLELRLRAAEQDIEAARASLSIAEAALQTHLVSCDEASLTLERTEIRAPVAGLVLSRQVEPGSRLSMFGGSDAMAGVIVRLYDPAKLQVRVDVPLADSAKIDVGTAAQVVTEALPDTVFSGKVILVGREANIQRNTVPVKVVIEEPAPTLRPEMLARVRFYTGPHGKTAASARGDSTAPAHDQPGVRLFVPAAALLTGNDGSASVWLVEQVGGSKGTVAALRDVTVGSATTDGYSEITRGLKPGDRLIVDPPATLKAGVRVRVLGEKLGAAPN